jgi:hypothetical protein
LSVYNRTYVRALTPLAGTWVSNGSSGREASRWRVAGGRVSHSGTALGFYYCVALLVLPAARSTACRLPPQPTPAGAGSQRPATDTTRTRWMCRCPTPPRRRTTPSSFSRSRRTVPRWAASRSRCAPTSRRAPPRTSARSARVRGAGGGRPALPRPPLPPAACCRAVAPPVRRPRACPHRPAASPRRLTCSGGSDAASRAQHAGADSNTDSGGGAAVRCGGALAQGRRATATRARRSTASSPASCARVETSRRGTAPAAGSDI